MTIKAQSVGGGGGTLYSAPSDNKCGGFGGCAVPISASQLYPTSGEMAVFDIHADQQSKRGVAQTNTGHSAQHSQGDAFHEHLAQLVEAAALRVGHWTGLAAVGGIGLAVHQVDHAAE